MSPKRKLVQATDVPILKLVPRNERRVSTRYRHRLAASLADVGLLEPLLVQPQGDKYEILDGCLRYRLLLRMGVKRVSCLIRSRRRRTR